GDLGCLLERYRLHVVGGNFGANSGDLGVVDRLDGDAGERGLTTQIGRVGQQERAAAIVEQPLGRRAGLDRVVGEAVRLEVILLRVVHRNEELLGQGGRRAHGEQAGGDEQRAPGRGAERLFELVQFIHAHYTDGVAALRASSSRRACGTSALCGRS